MMRAPALTFKRARALRGQLTLPEVVLWQALRNARVGGLRFRRQHPVGPYILDFFCASAQLGVEIDGASHDHSERARHDARRDAWLAERNIRVLRFAAADVLKDEGLDGALMTIVEAAGISADAPSVGCADSSPARGGASAAGRQSR